MAEEFDDLGVFRGPRLPLKSAINFNDLMAGKSIKFEINGDDIIPQEEDDDSDYEDDRGKPKPRAKKFYEDPDYQWQPDDDKTVQLDECVMDFDELEENMESIHDSGKIKKLVMKPGNSNKVKESSKLFIHYAAFAEGAIEPFDKQCGEGRRSRVIHLGKNEIFYGLKLGLLTMSTGEIARFIFYPEFAFGELGCPPRIPGGVRIMYSVELLRFVVQDTASDIRYMSVDERSQMPFQQIVDAALLYRNEGNLKYKLGDHRGALRFYTQAILLLEDYATSNESENKARENEIPELCVNKAQTLLKLGLPAKACIAIKLGLRYTDHKNKPRLLIRFAEAKFQLEAYDDALRLCKEAVQIFKSQDVHEKKHTQLFDKIKNAIQKEKEADAFLCRQMLGLNAEEAGGKSANQ